MNFTKPPKPAEKADAQHANPLWIITAMLAIFAAAAAAIIGLG
jgi:hypothetical protein